MKCSKCGREAEDAKFKQCSACRESYRNYRKQPKWIEYNRNYQREWIRTHRKVPPEGCCIRCGKPLESNLFAKCEQCLQSSRDWFSLNPDKALKYARKSREANHDRHLNYIHNYRARKKGNGGTFTFKELNELFEQQEGFCYYCGELLYASFDREIHIEHKIPISRGGSNDITNIVLSCAKCNLSKGAKTDVEFLKLVTKQK
jgi:hypothetical protein